MGRAADNAQGAEAHGDFMILSCGDLEKALGFETADGTGRLPNTYDLLLVLFRSLRSGFGIDAIEVPKCVAFDHPRCVVGILELLGDDEIDGVDAAADSIQAITIDSILSTGDRQFRARYGGRLRTISQNAASSHAFQHKVAPIPLQNLAAPCLDLRACSSTSCLALKQAPRFHSKGGK